MVKIIINENNIKKHKEENEVRQRKIDYKRINKEEGGYNKIWKRTEDLRGYRGPALLIFHSSARQQIIIVSADHPSNNYLYCIYY